jgi:DNA polymerase III epsilon subunit-like protein
MEQLDFLGIDYEELEDGMPRPMKEIELPDFDSFVAFDIETTGTYGAANGDAPAEITEIGAVKVEGGNKC